MSRRRKPPVRRRAAAAWLPLALALGCAAASPPCPGPPVDLIQLERRVHALVNQHRTASSRPPLAWSPELTGIARAHSAAMSSGRRISHRGFRDRYRQAASFRATRTFAENVATSCGTGPEAAKSAVRRWLASPSHRRAIDGAFRRTGVGAAQDGSGRIFLTQLFAAP